jgi:fucose 4-O-acetylase-like acetyltransferase
MKRIDYLDRARAIGIFLVYYGHFITGLVPSPSGLAATQWRLIYSFHVPLFFFLAGIFWKPNPLLAEVFLDKLKTRILPVVSFSLLLVPFWFVFAPARLLRLLAFSGLYLQGLPLLNLVTWFLICLFSVELLAALTARFLTMTPPRIILYSLIYFMIGFYALINGLSTTNGFAAVLPKLLQFENACIAIVFFFVGYLLKKPLILMGEPTGWIISLPILFASGYILLKTFDLNQSAGQVVLMIASKYGDPILFLITAFAGIFFILALSRLLVWNKLYINFVGQNTLIYLGLNGLGFHFLDSYVIQILPINLKSHLEVFLYTSTYVVIIMLIFVPVVMALRRWLPELVGMPWSTTSVLPLIGT